MLNGIHLVDFGNHRDTRLTFGRMTALVGQNGSGKTTVMRSIGDVDRTFFKWRSDDWIKKVRRGAKHPIVSASWSVQNEEGMVDWGLRMSTKLEFMRRLRPTDAEKEIWLPDPFLERPHVSESGRRFRNLLDDDFETKVKPGVVEHYHQESVLPFTARYFKTSARALQNPAIADQETPSINGDGSNLAWALSYLMTAEPELFAKITGALKEVVPVVKRIRSRPTRLTRMEKRTITINKQDRTFDEEREVMGQELIFDMKSGDGLAAISVSEGTLVALAILTLVYGSKADLIMLDDVELGLHPRAQRDLIRQLRRIQETHPALQILVSSHSPYIIDEFDAEDVWVFAPDKEGCAVTKRLSDHPDAKRALEVLTTGEFWSAEGEPWVLDEEPTARVAEEPSR